MRLYGYFTAAHDKATSKETRKALRKICRIFGKAIDNSVGGVQLSSLRERERDENVSIYKAIRAEYLSLAEEDRAAWLEEHGYTEEDFAEGVLDEDYHAAKAEYLSLAEEDRAAWLEEHGYTEEDFAEDVMDEDYQAAKAEYLSLAEEDRAAWLEEHGYTEEDFAEDVMDEERGQSGEEKTGTDAERDFRYAIIKERISNTVDKALNQKGNINEKYNQVKISEFPASISTMVNLASEGRITLQGKYVAINGDDIWHEYKRHKDEAIEVGRRQLPFTPETIKEAIMAIYNPDMVESIFTTNQNPTQRQSFAYAKKSANGYYIVVEAVGGKRNPNVTPVMLLCFSEEKWQDMISSGLTLGEVLYENDTVLRHSLDVAYNKKNRVTAAQFASNEAIANTPRSPRYNNIISETSAKSNPLGEKSSGKFSSPESDERSSYAKGKTLRSDAATGMSPENVQVRGENNEYNESLHGDGVSADTQFALVEKFKNELQEWFDSTTEEERAKSGKRFYIGKTTEVLKSIDVKDADVYFGGSKINKILSKNESMSVNTISQAVSLLENPILIMESKTVSDSIVVFGEVYTTSNKPVMISLLINPKNKNGEILDYVVITSAYGRRASNLQNLIDKSRIYYVCEDKKRTDTWLKALGLQLPSAITTYGSIDSILKNPPKINTSIKNSSGKFSSPESDERSSYVTGTNSENVQVRGEDDFRLSIKKDTGGNLFVEVDAPSGVSATDTPEDIADALAEIVRTKFTDFVKVNGQAIGINQRTAREWVKSKSADTLRRFSNQAFLDKENAFGNADELLQAARNYIGEAAKHSRKDNFVEFARGVVAFQVDGRGYEADIIVGTTKSGVALLYDLVNIQGKKIVADTSYAAQDRRSDAPATNNSITETSAKSNPLGKKSSGKFSSPESDERSSYVTGTNSENVQVADGSISFSSMNEAFQKRLDSWDRNTEGFSFVLGDTSSVLSQMKINEKKIGKKQIRIDATKIKKILADHSEMTIEAIKNLPRLINAPILVLDSKTVEGRLVLLGEVYAKNNKPVMVALEINPSTRNGKSSYVDVVKIASAYTRQNTQNLINNSNIRYVDPNKNRVNNWLKVNRLQLPLPNSQYDSAINSIAETSAKSNPLGEKSSGKFSSPESDERSSYAKDSVTQKITAEMSDAERAEILSRKQVVAPIYTGQADATILANKDAFEQKKMDIVKTVIATLGDEFGLVGGQISFEDVDIEVTLSKTNLRESTTKQATPAQLAKLIPVLKPAAQTAVGIERHDNRYFFDNDTIYFDNLLGGYIDGDDFVPVRFGLKYSKSGNVVLYVVIDQNKIPVSNLTEIKNDTGHQDAKSDLTEVGGPRRRVTFSIAQIIQFVNSGDALRYLPDEMLSEEQKVTKWEAVAETAKYTAEKNDKKYFDYIKNGNLRDARRMIVAAARAAGYTIEGYHGTRQTFTAFSSELKGSNTRTETSKRMFFAADKATANSYYPYGVMQAIHEQHPEWAWADPEKVKVKGNLYHLFIRMNNPLTVDVADYDYAAHRDSADAWMEFVAQAEANHNDGIILLNAMDNQLDTSARASTVYMFAQPSQAKSAETITYDDEGNIIPISKRFDAGNPDMRFSKVKGNGHVYKEIAEVENLKVYEKEDAEKIINNIMSVLIPFSEDGSATLSNKNKKEAEQLLWERLNLARGEAEKEKMARRLLPRLRRFQGFLQRIAMS